MQLKHNMQGHRSECFNTRLSLPTLLYSGCIPREDNKKNMKKNYNLENYNYY